MSSNDGIGLRMVSMFGFLIFLGLGFRVFVLGLGFLYFLVVGLGFRVFVLDLGFLYLLGLGFSSLVWVSCTYFDPQCSTFRLFGLV